MSWYAANGGTLLKVYYRCNEYGWLWFFLQVPIVFMYQVGTSVKCVIIWDLYLKVHFIFQDYLTYWTHRMYHNPRFYERFHKMHHKYKQPTAFSVTAIHVRTYICYFSFFFFFFVFFIHSRFVLYSQSKLFMSNPY